MNDDIFERKRAEAGLARLAAIIESSEDAIISIDLEGIIETWNPAAERLYGYSSAEAIGRPIFMVEVPQSSFGWRYLLEQVRRGERLALVEAVRQAKDGARGDVALRASPIYDSEGQIVGVSAIVRDISERKLLQQHLLEIAEEEQRLIGHELHDGTGQELTGLALFAGTLLDLLNSGKHRKSRGKATWTLSEADYLRLHQTALKLAEGLAQAHRHIQKICRGIIPVQINPDGLRAALEELADSTNAQQHVRCRFEYTGPIVITDIAMATHLYRIAQEALTNALRHAQADQILISLRRVDGHFVLEVQDNGVGIRPPDAAPEKRLSKGMGMQIMEYRAGMLGGVLEVQREPRGGTRVTCRVSCAGQVPQA